MLVLSLPASPAIATVDWTLTQPTQANRSEFTGARRVTILAAAPRWSAKLKFVQAIGERSVKPLRAFLAALQGQAGQFRLPATETPQASAGASVVTIDGAGQGGSSLATKGWVAGAHLDAGDFVTIGGQLLQLTSPVLPDGAGKAQLAFMPYIRAVPADGAGAEVLRPYATMSLTTDAAGWSVGAGQIYDVSLDCEESF